MYLVLKHIIRHLDDNVCQISIKLLSTDSIFGGVREIYQNKKVYFVLIVLQNKLHVKYLFYRLVMTDQKNLFKLT